MPLAYLAPAFKSQLWRILLFALSIVGPFIKVRIIGAVSDLDIQLQYVSYYFAIQFFTPLVDFGASWSSIRGYIERKDAFLLFITPVGAIAGVAVGLFFFEYGLVILISLAMAIFNYHLQVLRLVGKPLQFYLYKIFRLALDIALIFTVFILASFDETAILSYVLSGELLSVSIILFLMYISTSADVSYIFKGVYFAGARDYTFLILKILRANFFRLSAPFVFDAPQFIKVFYLLLLYELVIQFANAEYIRKIVDKGLNFRYASLAWGVSIPVQILFLYAFSLFMDWNFSLFEYFCIFYMGSISVYSIFSFRIISLGGYDSFRRIVFWDLLVKGAMVAILYLLDATYGQILCGLLLNYSIWFGCFVYIHVSLEKEKS